MNLQEYTNNLKQLAGDASAKLALNIRVPAANMMLATIKNRIIREGKASDNSEIGRLSTKPAYFSRKAFVVKGAFKPQGKNGARKGAKSMYLPEGYAQFKGIQGRERSKANMQLSGSMMLDYQQAIQGATILQGFTNKKESDKRKGNEARFNKRIFPATEQEIQAYNKECAEGYAELTVKILTGE